jgi:hypothetical protein
MRVAGLAPVELPGIENVDVTEFVPGHMSYRKAMPRLLRESGWAIESDEFTEIEDPDPDNHEKRQRQLINEIEEARKQLQQKPEKKRFAFFSRKKLAKQEWETYDDRTKEGESGKRDEDSNGNVLFDIEAIRKEVANIAAEGIEVKELESTLPPMKLDLKSCELPPLMKSKSQSDAVPSSINGSSEKDLPPPPYHRGSQDEQIYMQFDPECEVPSSTTPATSTFSSIAGSPPPVPDKTDSAPSQRLPLNHALTMPPVINLEHNAWADEDEEFGKETEMTMTFE